MLDARIALLQDMPIFGGLRRATLAFILEHCPIVTRHAGEAFFREGDDGDQLYVLEQGEAVVLKSWRGTDVVVRNLNTGDCFGEMAVMDHCRRSATVKAVQDCSAIEISAANLYRVYGHDLKEFAMIQMNMGREVSRRLREANERLFHATAGQPDRSPGHT